MPAYTTFLRSSVAAIVVTASPLAARADDMAYMGTDAGQFGIIDLATGVFSQLGNSGQTLAGFGVDGGQLYASSYHTTGQLFTVSRSSGAVTLVGDSGITFDDFGSTLTGLYGVSTDGKLYSVSATDGSSTLIGSTGLGLGGWRALSTNSSTLYFADGSSLYTLSTTTGAATLVGNMGGPQMGALLMEHGTLYGGTDSPVLTVATLDASSGVATVGPALVGSSSPFFALAPVPEPAPAVLYGLGLAALLASARRACRRDAS